MYRTYLEQCAVQDEPIRVGIIGAGKFGAGVVAQLSRMQGIEASLIADLDPNRARYAYTASYVPEADICEATSIGEAEQAILDGRPAVKKVEDHLGRNFRWKGADAFRGDTVVAGGDDYGPIMQGWIELAGNTGNLD